MEKSKDTKPIREDTVRNTSLKLLKCDIIKVPGGALLNPTNNRLSRNSGLTTHIIDTAGMLLLMELNQWKKENNQLSPGEIYATCAGTLPVVRIFHCFIPPYDRSDPEPLVKSFVANALHKAEELRISSIIFPCLPKNVYLFTPEQCAYGYYACATEYIESNRGSCITEIKFVTLDDEAAEIFELEAGRRFGIREKKKKNLFGFLKKKKSCE